MQVEYVQKLFCGKYIEGKVVKSCVKRIETIGEEPQYFCGIGVILEIISEQEFEGILKEIKKEIKKGASFVDYKTISEYNDIGQKISEVTYIDSGARQSISALINKEDGKFEYSQIKQKKGRCSIGGKLASSYMKISFNGEESEYIDRQPDLEDSLLDIRDRFVNPYMDVFFGNVPLSHMSNDEPVA